MTSSLFTRLFLRYCRSFNHPCKFRLIALVGRWLLPSRGLVVSLAEGFAMRLQVFDHLERCLVVRGDYEPMTSAFVRKNVRPGSIAAVAGANIGYYPLLLARAVGPTGRVLGVEPFPGNLARCEHNLQLNPALAGPIVLFSGALGRRSDYVRIPAPPAEHSGLAHLSREATEGAYVKVERFTDLTERLLPRRPDLMILDVEGWETEALAGMAAARPEILVIEYDRRHIQSRGLTTEAYFAALHTLGYSLSHFDGSPARPDDNYPEQTLIGHQPEASPVWI